MLITNTVGRSLRVCVLVLVLVFVSSSVGFATSSSPALPELFRPDQLLWQIELGLHQYTVPQIDRERIYLGINDRYLEHPMY